MLNIYLVLKRQIGLSLIDFIIKCGVTLLPLYLPFGVFTWPSSTVSSPTYACSTTRNIREPLRCPFRPSWAPFSSHKSLSNSPEMNISSIKRPSRTTLKLVSSFLTPLTSVFCSWLTLLCFNSCSKNSSTTSKMKNL